jgi:hypothetical protein
MVKLNFIYIKTKSKIRHRVGVSSSSAERNKSVSERMWVRVPVNGQITQTQWFWTLRRMFTFRRSVPSKKYYSTRLQTLKSLTELHVHTNARTRQYYHVTHYTVEHFSNNWSKKWTISQGFEPSPDDEANFEHKYSSITLIKIIWLW